MKRRTLEVGDVIIPYQSGHPICLFDNTTDSGEDTFIRAKFHQGVDAWYSEVDAMTGGEPARPRDPRHWKSQGAIIFLAEESIPVGSGIVIRRVNRAGNSGHGRIIVLPTTGIVYPYDVDVGKLFRKIGEA